MTIKIEVKENDIHLLLDFYHKKLKALKEEIGAKENEVRSINSMIIQLKNADKQHEKKADRAANVQDDKKQKLEYYPEWPWVAKIKFALKTQGRPLTSKEIIEVLTDFEPSLLFEQKRTLASVSSALSLNFGKGKNFIRFEGPSGYHTYNLREQYPGVDNDNQLIETKG